MDAKQILKIADEVNLGDITADGKLIAFTQPGELITRRVLSFADALFKANALAPQQKPRLEGVEPITARIMKDSWATSMRKRKAEKES